MVSEAPDEWVQGDNSSRQGEIAAFRQAVKQARERDPLGWEATRKLVGQHRLHTTRSELAECIRKASLPGHIREGLLYALKPSASDQPLSSPSESLKHLTGLPTSKALRALSLYFRAVQGSSTTPAPPDIHTFLENNPNPYDLLLQSPHPTLLDLGAGDLSFEEELIEQYVPLLASSHRSLVVHALDRLQPGSQFGGAYHADKERMGKLKGFSKNSLQFRFWGGTDMADCLKLHGLLREYTIVTCHAPATPTFAIEPSRVSAGTITTYLEQTKGVFRTVRVHGEEALEVHHRGKALTFPAWKFAIQGPLVLLELLARKGMVGVLSAVDNEVFWEILSQLLEDQRYRPPNVIFTRNNLPGIFGTIYHTLSALQPGGTIRLGELSRLRSRIPFRLPTTLPESPGYSFSRVVIRRGAIFEGMPASFTARQFLHMSEEPPPWCLILTPDPLVKI